MRQFEKMHISAIKCGKFGQKMQHIIRIYNTSVKAIGKHKHIIFRHLSTAVDNTARTVCHNINKKSF